MTGKIKVGKMSNFIDKNMIIWYNLIRNKYCESGDTLVPSSIYPLPQIKIKVR